MIFFRSAKQLKVEALYQLFAASLASFFRSRTLEEVVNDVNLHKDMPMQTKDEEDIHKRFAGLINENERIVDDV
jgi:hypothetical protein